MLPAMPDSQPDAGPPETFHIRMNGDQPIRLPVAEMTPEDARLAITFQEHELAIMAGIAAPTLMLLQQASTGEHAMSPSELRDAYKLTATLIRVQEQTHRLREAVSRRDSELSRRSLREVQRRRLRLRVDDCTADHCDDQRTHDEQRGHWRLSAELDTEELPPADDPLSSAEMPQPLTTQWPGETP